MTEFLLFADSSNSVLLEPEYSFQSRSTKIQAEIRTQDGGLKQYKFAEYPAFKVPVKYMPQSDTLQIREWCSSNTNLKFVYLSSEYNVRITNDRDPLPKFTKPYNNLYEGTIELEGY